MLIELRIIVFFHAGAPNFLWHFNRLNEKVKRRPKFTTRLTKRSALVYMIIKKCFAPPRVLSFPFTRPGIDAGFDILLLFILYLLRVGSIQQTSLPRKALQCNGHSLYP